MQVLIAKQAPLKQLETQERIKEIDRWIERLAKERATLVRKLGRGAKRPTDAAVECPRCGRDHDFLTDNGGYLAHVLEDPQDTEALESGKPLFCPSCGDVFLYAPPRPAAA